MTDTNGFVGGTPTAGPVHPDNQIRGNLMEDELPTVTTAAQRDDLTDGESKLLSTFKKLTGYRDRDVIGLNGTTLTVVTSNGGKYQVNRQGTRLRHLSGPLPKKAKAVVRSVAYDVPTPQTASDETNLSRRGEPNPVSPQGEELKQRRREEKAAAAKKSNGDTEAPAVEETEATEE